MHLIPFANTHELTPGAAHLAAERLASWLPIGPVAVLGVATTALTRSLAAYGIPVVGELTPSMGEVRALVIVVPHRTGDPTEASSQLSALLGDIDVPVCLLISGGTALVGSRAFWEGSMMVLDWRKHPLNEVLAPYGELDRVVGLQMVAFERVPEKARAVYPLRVLAEERDLHTDMTREPGRRSDAHMTRYAQAARFIRRGDRVIDVACGLGYGSYQIAHNCEASSLIGLDASEYAVNYAQSNFVGCSPIPMKFVLGNAQHLRDMKDGSADFAVSVETLEHIPEPDLLLAELSRVLSPGGRIYASVPNDWSDETGEDPNPFHIHVYDWRRLKAQFLRNGFEIERAWLQDAGGGQKRHSVGRSMLEIDPERGPPCDGEWLLVLACKKNGIEADRLEPISRLREMLWLGSREGTVDVLHEIAASSVPLKSALAHVIYAWSGLASGRDGVIDDWSHAYDRACDAVGAPAGGVAAAALLALSSDVLQQLRDGSNTSGVLGRMYARHAAAVQLVLGERSFHNVADDRAVVAGGEDGDEGVNISGRDVRTLMGAKEWLDSKYHEHLEKIGQLEAYTNELERARRWLDHQYHTLSAEVSRLAANSGSGDR